MMGHNEIYIVKKLLLTFLTDLTQFPKCFKLEQETWVAEFQKYQKVS